MVSHASVPDRGWRIQSAAERSQATRDASAGGRFGDREASGDVAVGQLLDHPHPERLAVLDRQGAELPGNGVTQLVQVATRQPRRRAS